MMGSRRRVAIVKDQLAAKGISRELLDSVHTHRSVLKIGAETPEEIAVSIVAEIIRVKHSGVKCGSYPKALLSAILAGRRQTEGAGNDHLEKRLCAQRNRDEDADL